MYIQTINPATGEDLNQYAIFTPEQVKEKIQNTHQAFLSWRGIDLPKRLELFSNLIQVLNQEKQACAQLISTEMGKPIQFAKAEIDKCILCCQYYIEHAMNFLQPHQVQTEFHASFVTYNPLGVILAVMPWNFPFWQVLRCVIPTMIAGNTVILKHASIVTGSALKIEELFIKAGFPTNSMTTLAIESSSVAGIIAHPSVRGVTLTGSEDVGRKIASDAAPYLKKVSLELGGNDACLVLEDANLKEAAKAIVASRLRNSGQVCVSSKRVIAHTDIHDQLVEEIRLEMAKYQMGAPLDEKTNLGPMARGDLREILHQQVLKMIEQGATLLEGGCIPEGKGFYYPPTLLTNVTKDSIAYQEELFGPVIAVTRFNEFNEGIDLANCTRFGLGGSVFSANIEQAEYLASQVIEAGVCFVNLPVTSDPRLPFGGIKDSGYGRELSKEGLIEFTNIKTVIVNAK